jgi:hypothetical protein
MGKFEFVFWPVALMFFLLLALPTTARAAGDTADLNGVLLDATGQPAEGYPMALKTPDGVRVVIQGTGAGGSFGMGGLPPGAYEILALKKEDQKTPVASQKVTLAAGQKARVEMRLTSNAPTADTAGAATAATKAAAATPAAAAGSTDSEGAGSGWMISMLAGLGVLALCIGSAIYVGRRSRQQVSG